MWAQLDVYGLPALSRKGTALIHQHLDLFVHGKRVAVPTGIGIDAAELPRAAPHPRRERGSSTSSRRTCGRSRSAKFFGRTLHAALSRGYYAGGQKTQKTLTVAVDGTEQIFRGDEPARRRRRPNNEAIRPEHMSQGS